MTTSKEKIISNVNFLRELIMQAPGFVIIYLYRHHEIYLANKAFEDLVCQSNLSGLTIDDIAPEFTRNTVREKLDKVWETGQPYIGHDIPILIYSTDEKRTIIRYVDMIYQPLRSTHGEMIGVYVQGIDVTQKRNYEEEIKFLNGESLHRIKNIISVSKAIILQTIHTSDDIASARQKIAKRLDTLSSAQNTIAGESIFKLELRNIIKDELATTLATFPHIIVEGPDIHLPKRYCVPLSLTLHELATNAIKHGALSTLGGALSIRWVLLPNDMLSFFWIEKIASKPSNTTQNGKFPLLNIVSKKGFGSKLIQRSLNIHVRNKIITEYKPDGFSCYIDLYIGDE